jgi:hypothetical protein
MAIFHSYVSLPEGNVVKTILNHPPVITIFTGTDHQKWGGL